MYCFPKHVNLSFEHNAHKACYQTVADHYADKIDCWVSKAQCLKAIAEDSVWELIWYPETPVGFHCLLACDLEELLKAANAEASK